MWVIKMQFGVAGEEMPRYVKDLEDPKLYSEQLDPSTASKFKTKKAANKWVQVFSSYGEYASAVSLESARIEFDAWLSQGFPMGERVKINQVLNKPYNGEDLQGILDWQFKYRTLPEGSVSYDVYKTWPDLIENHSKFLYEVRSYTSSDYTKTYLGVEIMVRRGDEYTYQDFKKEIDLVKGRITYRHDPVAGHNAVSIGIFDNHLSEGGYDANLVYHKTDGTWSVYVGYRGKTEALSKTTLKECFEYIKKNNYYGD